jgi:hypothetical protein
MHSAVFVCIDCTMTLVGISGEIIGIKCYESVTELIGFQFFYAFWSDIEDPPPPLDYIFTGC